jgi:chemotaxis protein MotB
MAMNRKKIEPEENAGAPEWMVTFSDCMTLLLTFFVLLLSFSSFDRDSPIDIAESIGIQSPMPDNKTGSKSVSLATITRAKKIEEIAKGSKTPTLSDKAIGNITKKRRLTDYQRQKVFSIPSKEIFAGNASVINPKNIDVLKNMTIFLKAKPSRVVISEFSPEDPHKSDRVSVQRAWSIMKFFIDANVDASRFSITGSSMFVKNDNVKERQVIITLLEEDTYK